MNRKLKIFLTLSIILNLLLIGALGGFSYKRWQHHKPFEREMLSAEAQQVLRDTFTARRENMRETFAEARASRNALADILAADEFDPDAFDAAIAQKQVLTDRIMQAHIDGVRALALALPDDDRKKMARHLAGRLDPMSRKKHARRPAGNNGGRSADNPAATP